MSERVKTHEDAGAEPAAGLANGAHPRSASSVLADLVARPGSARITVGEIVDGLGERAFGLVMLILALPCAVPFLYGVPQVVSVPLLIVAAQIAVRPRRLWLPDALRKRSFSVESFAGAVDRAAPYLRWLEKVARPRLGALLTPGMERVLGALMFVFSVSIMLPLPMTNTFPGVAIAIMAVGLIERDGVLVALGATIGTAWVTFLVLGAGLIAAFLASVFGG
jgi:hypothetical protein